MKRYRQDFADMELNPDGEWIRYTDHCEAMKRIAAAPVVREQSKEREAFEAWLTGGKPSTATERKAIYPGLCGWDEYRSTHTEAMWDAWRARAALSAGEAQQELTARPNPVSGVSWSGVSWSGFNVHGDEASAREVRHLIDKAATVPELQRYIKELEGHLAALAPRQMVADSEQAEPVDIEQIKQDYYKQGFTDAQAMLAAQPPAAAEAERDAARYRWLREQDDSDGLFIAKGFNGTWGECGHRDLWGETADEAIDAAMSASKERPTQAPEKP